MIILVSTIRSYLKFRNSIFGHNYNLVKKISISIVRIPNIQGQRALLLKTINTVHKKWPRPGLFKFRSFRQTMILLFKIWNVLLSYHLTRQDRECHSSEVVDIASALRHLPGTTEGRCNDHRIYWLRHVDSFQTLHKIQRILSSSPDHMDLKNKCSRCRQMKYRFWRKATI